MQFSLEKDVFHYVIHSCSDAGVLVNKPIIRDEASANPDSATINNGKQSKTVLMKRSFIITANRLDNWDKEAVLQITSEDVEQWLSYEPEIVILGTGKKQEWPDMKLFESLYANQIGLEVMCTDAACRTYNLLMSDSRRVVAAMLVAG